jgi:hypothetical protein
MQLFLPNSSLVFGPKSELMKHSMAAALVQTEQLQSSKPGRDRGGFPLRSKGGRAPCPRMKYPADQVLRMPWPGPRQDTFPAKGEPGDWQSTVQAAADIGLVPT